MTMKKISLFLLPVAMLLGGCEKFLDQQPISSLSTELFWKTAEDARLGNAAIYDGLQKTLTDCYIDWGDARSDNFTYSGTGDYQILVTMNGLTSLTSTANWNDLYMTIARANVAIQQLPSVKALSDVDRNHYLAQAHAARAYMYFYAVRLWGDVPVWTAPYGSMNEDPKKPRSSADSVLNSVIIPDLQKALTLINKSLTNVYEINQGSILAMLTDVHMWKKDYPAALASSAAFIALPYKYDVNANTVASLKNIFINPAGNKEVVLTLNWDYTRDGENFMGARLGSNSNTSTYEIDSSVTVKFQADRGDLRRWNTFDTALWGTSTKIAQIWKYYDYDPVTSKPKIPSRIENNVKIPLYRTADVLLLRAEALNRTGDKTGAFTIVNRIRTLRGAKLRVPASYTTVDASEDAVLDERQLELFAESRRWFDLVRTGRVLQVVDPLIRERQREQRLQETGFTDARKILWPISRDALTRNPLLVQNPPYSE